MSLTISQDVSDANDRVASLRATLGALVERLFNSRHVLIRHIISLSSIEELARQIGVFTLIIFSDWLNVSDDLSVLTSTARLLLV